MSYTKTVHTSTYPSISPSRPELSLAGKTVLITGASSGIGRAAGPAFAVAGAKAIILVARRADKLAAAADEVRAKVKEFGPAAAATVVETYTASITDAAAVAKVFASAKEKHGGIDVVVHAAAADANVKPLATVDIDQLWGELEVNIKGALIMGREFLASRGDGKDEGVLIALNTAGAILPGLPGMGGYLGSKLGMLKMWEVFGKENDGKIRVMTPHPGLNRSEGALVLEEAGYFFPYDDASLPPDFLVWLASEEAAFLKNRFVFANWDVDELKARKDEILNSADLTIGLTGFPRVFE